VNLLEHMIWDTAIFTLAGMKRLAQGYGDDKGDLKAILATSIPGFKSIEISDPLIHLSHANSRI
jgi:hypothetical protein